MSEPETGTRSNDKESDVDLESIDDFNLNKTSLVENQSISDELNPLHFQVKKLQKLLIHEQEKYSKLQKQLQDSENQRLELISSSNREIFSLTTQFTKLRSDYEKNEAIRRSLEYELTYAKNSLNKEKNLISEKDKLSEENSKFYQDQIKNLKNFLKFYLFISSPKWRIAIILITITVGWQN